MCKILSTAILRLVIFSFLFIACGCSDPARELLTQPVDPVVAEKGRALVQGLAACGFCHGQATDPSAPLVGGRPFFDKFGEARAANLTPSRSGIGTKTTNEILRAVRASVGSSDRRLSPELHRGFEWLSDEDAVAVVVYLRSLPAVDHAVESRSLGFIDRNTTGFFDRIHEVRGYVPKINARFQPEYGRYLLEHVARCQSCHNSEETLLSSERYLAGGKTIRTDAGEKTAPGLSSAEGGGLSAWSEQDVVTYLEHGVTPEGVIIDPNFCPTAYYRLAPAADLQALAKYIKSVQAR